MAKVELTKLTEDEITHSLAALPGWSLDHGKISHTFTFSTYLEGLVFATVVGSEAQRMNHHPDILISYGKVKVSVNTHDVGGISKLDFDLAHRISAVSSK